MAVIHNTQDRISKAFANYLGVPEKKARPTKKAWVHHDSQVAFTDCFYCENPLYADLASDPDPMWYVPHFGYSVTPEYIHETCKDACDAARKFIAAKRLLLDGDEAALPE